MKKRLLLHVAMACSLGWGALFLTPVGAQLVGTSAEKHHKIVIQVSDSDPAKWDLALNNAKNLQDNMHADNVDIEIVAYGPGIGMLKRESPLGSRIKGFVPDSLRSMLKFDSPFAPRIAQAMKANMKVFACENSMRGQKLTRDDMLAGVAYVPAGVSEIIKKQGEGWAYLRP